MPLLSRRDFIKLLSAGSSLLPLGALSLPARAAPLTGVVPSDIFHVNGRGHTFPKGDVSLLDFLRVDLGLTGAKYACGIGVCGACTVLINGKAIKSCVVKCSHLTGMQVQTVEGLGGAAMLHPVQKTFADLSVFQCGYCAPGMVMSTCALLQKIPRPTRRQIQRGLYGNLCRCTGYARIVEAVRAVNDPDYAEYLSKRPHSGVVEYTPDILAEDKVTGRLKYARDHALPGQLHCKVVWSEHPHARIPAIDTEQAKRFPGVHAVLVGIDVPGKKTWGSIIPDQPVLADTKVRCRGDAVAVVAAESLEQAKLAASFVKVTYEPLQGVFSPEESLKPGAPYITGRGNVCYTENTAKGDVGKGRAQAKAVIKSDYTTPYIEHAYMEPEGCLTYVDEQGRLIVVSGGQAPHSYRSQIAAICNLPKDRVQIQTTVAGGAFGAKADLSVQHLCALVTLTTGKPARLELTREESIRMHVKRHPFSLHYETGADENGRLTYCVVEAVVDAGAYHSATLAVVENAVGFATGPYQIDNVDVRVTAAFTNNPVCGAMRGFGVPQVCFAMERQIDSLAAALKMDPLELRLLNCLEEGKVSQWGQVMGQGVGIKPCLQSLKKATREAAASVEYSSEEKLGLGFAAMYKNTSTPTDLPIGSADVTMELSSKGLVIIYVGGCELGQGLVTSLTQIGAAALNLPVKRVRLVHGSTEKTSTHSHTTASQQLYLGGGAIIEAAPLFRDKLLKIAAVVKGLPENVGKQMVMRADGVYRPTGAEDEEKVIGIEELAFHSRLQGLEPTLTHKYTPAVKTVSLPKVITTQGPDQKILPSLGYAAHAALVAVNTKTGAVRVLKIYAAQDVGRVINPDAIEGQIIGGVVMGLGPCFKERLTVENGEILEVNFDRYLIPRVNDIPEIIPLVIEQPDELGPFGAKGIGELPLVPVAPAVMNAVYDAVGVKLNHMPVTPEDVLVQLKDQEEAKA